MSAAGARVRSALMPAVSTFIEVANHGVEPSYAGPAELPVSLDSKLSAGLVKALGVKPQ